MVLGLLEVLYRGHSQFRGSVSRNPGPPEASRQRGHLPLQWPSDAGGFRV